MFWAVCPRNLDTSSRQTRLSGSPDPIARKGNKEASEGADALEAWREEAELLSLWMCIEVLAVMAASVIHRQHLFVWTVFSPKFLYMAAWVICWHLAANIGFAGILAWAG